MSDHTNIEWTDATWNPLRGCTKVSAGCRGCYAEKVAARFAGPGLPYEGLTTNGKWNGAILLLPEHLADPLRWQKPRRIFVNSMSDLFHESVSNEYIAAVFGVMAAAPWHTFQVLTKRPERAREWFEWLRSEWLDNCGVPPEHTAAACWGALLNEIQSAGMGHPALQPKLKLPGLRQPFAPVWPLPNVWIGVSVEDQASADKRINVLRSLPAAVRFLSCEPLLGQVDVSWFLRGSKLLHSGASVDGMIRNRIFDGLVDYGGKPMDPTSAKAELLRLQADGVRMIQISSGAGAGCDNWSAQTGCGGHKLPGIDWVIVGGESGPGARPMHPDWARSVRDQCIAAQVPFFFKQWGEWAPYVHESHFTHGGPEKTPHSWVKKSGEQGLCWLYDDDGTWQNWTGDPMATAGGVLVMGRCGKHAAGRVLDGRTWDEMPDTAGAP